MRRTARRHTHIRHKLYGMSLKSRQYPNNNLFFKLHVRRVHSDTCVPAGNRADCKGDGGDGILINEGGGRGYLERQEE